MRSRPFLNFSKFKIKNNKFCCFHINETQNNFLGFLLVIILLEQTFFLKKIQCNYQFVTKIGK